jgi:transposase
VASWITHWEQRGIVGLLDKKRSSRPHKLTEEERARVKKLLQENPRSLKKIKKLLKDECGKEISIDTIKRIAKTCQLLWKRMRKSVKHKRNEEGFLQAKSEILALQAQEEHAEIDIYYFDESGFTLEPLVPYAWQLKAQIIELPTSKSRRISVLGFLSKAYQFESFIFEGRIDTEVVVTCFDELSASIEKSTWIILDNAPQHTSRAFKAHIPAWEKRGLFIKYLPAYSPELNLIEILWRFIKYNWLPLSAYGSYSQLKKAVTNILRGVGTKYQIYFA